MKSITILAINKGQDGGSMSQSIQITEKTTVQSLNEAKNDFFAKADAAYGHWYYEVEGMDELTSEEKSILEQCELSAD